MAVEIIDAFIPSGLRVCALRVEDVGGDGGEVAGGEGGCETGVWYQGGIVVGVVGVCVGGGFGVFGLADGEGCVGA